MEVILDSKLGLPEEAILSIRAGNVRRQATVGSAKPFRFPAGESRLKFDVMQRVGTGYLVMKPFADQEAKYRVVLNDDASMACEVTLRQIDQALAGQAVAEEDTFKQLPGAGAKEAKEYLDSTGLLKFLQDVLHVVIKDKPKDPFALMARYFQSGFDSAPPVPEAPPAPAEAAEEQPKEEAAAPAEEPKASAPEAEASAPEAEAPAAAEAPKEEAAAPEAPEAAEAPDAAEALEAAEAPEAAEEPEAAEAPEAEAPAAVATEEAVKAAPLEETIRLLQRTFSDNGFQYESFQELDQNKDGLLSREEWQAAIAAVLPNLHSVDADTVFGRFDANGDGFLNLDEFNSFFKEEAVVSPEVTEPVAAADVAEPAALSPVLVPALALAPVRAEASATTAMVLTPLPLKLGAPPLMMSYHTAFGGCFSSLQLPNLMLFI